jgi:hypothetical protein
VITPAFVVTVSTVSACATAGAPNPANDPTPPEPPVATADPPDPNPEPPTVPTTDPALAEDGGRAPVTTNPDPDPDAPPRLDQHPVTLNPSDAQGRTIQRAWQGDTCFVELPFPPLKPGQHRPPGSAPPTQTIPCPKAMLTPAYEQCRGGVVHGKSDGSSCLCFRMGNPPPPPKRIDCPAKP